MRGITTLSLTTLMLLCACHSQPAPIPVTALATETHTSTANGLALESAVPASATLAPAAITDTRVPPATSTPTEVRLAATKAAAYPYLPPYPDPGYAYKATLPPYPGAVGPTLIWPTQSVHPGETEIAATLTAFPTIVPSPTETPLNRISYRELPCRNRGDGTQRCSDELTGIRFDVPIEWGPIYAVLSRGDLSGLKYRYEFPADLSPLLDISAGGDSRYFAEGREPFILDFNGLDDGQLPRSCLRGNLAGLRHCEWIIENQVVLSIRFTGSNDICFPGPIIYYEPYIVILVDLPENQQVGGFAFAAHFLVEDDLNMLYANLDMDGTRGAPNCNPENMARFDEAATELLQRAVNRNLDEDANRVLKFMHTLAESIHIQ